MSDEDLAATFEAMSEAHMKEMLLLVGDDDRARAMSKMDEQAMERFSRGMSPAMKKACLELVKTMGFRKAQIQKLPRKPELPKSGAAHPSTQWQTAITQEKKTKEENRKALKMHKASLQGLSLDQYEKKLKREKSAAKFKK